MSPLTNLKDFFAIVDDLENSAVYKKGLPEPTNNENTARPISKPTNPAPREQRDVSRALVLDTNEMSASARRAPPPHTPSHAAAPSITPVRPAPVQSTPTPGFTTPARPVAEPASPSTWSARRFPGPAGALPPLVRKHDCSFYVHIVLDFDYENLSYLILISQVSSAQLNEQPENRRGARVPVRGLFSQDILFFLIKIMSVFA